MAITLVKSNMRVVDIVAKVMRRNLQDVPRVKFLLIMTFLTEFSGQPKRHLLTTGWSVFVSAKRLVAGDSVLFIW